MLRASLPLGLTLVAIVATMVFLAAPLLAVTAADLAPVETQSTVNLTTTGRKSGQPRLVTIWFVHEAGYIYLQAGKDGHTDWYRNLIENPDVKLEFGNLGARGKARPIDDPDEVARVHGLFRRKYWLSRVMSWFGGGFGAGKVVRVDLVDLVTS